MKQSDMEEELKKIKFHHLTQSELVSYCDQVLDQFSLARAEVHLKLCLICDRRLTYLKEERAALDNREITADSVALVRRVMQKMASGQSSDSRPAEAETEITLQDRLAECLRQIVESWRAHFSPLMNVRGAGDPGEEVWHWKSKEGVLKARAILEKNADLTIHFSTNDLSLEGVRLKIHIGPMNRKIILRRVADSEVSDSEVSDPEVHAQMKVPKRQRPRNLADISIEII